MPTAFQPFGAEHLVAIGLIPVVAGFLAVTRLRFPRTSKPIRYGLAFLLLVCTVSYYANWIINGKPIFPNHIPLEVCDFALWLVIVALLTLDSDIFDVVYYWALVGTALAVVTPNLTNESLFLKIQFFADHGLIVVGVLYLVWSREMRPRPGSALRSLIALNYMAVFVGLFDFAYKTNYMFLRDKPAGATLMNVLGPWPLYLVACEGVGLVTFPLLYLPFWGMGAPTRATEA